MAGGEARRDLGVPADVAAIDRIAAGLQADLRMVNAPLYRLMTVDVSAERIAGPAPAAAPPAKTGPRCSCSSAAGGTSK